MRAPLGGWTLPTRRVSALSNVLGLRAAGVQRPSARVPAWTEFDDRGVVKIAGVRPDGEAYSATQTYEQIGVDRFLFSVTDRIVGDDTAPDFMATVVRKPPVPAKPAAVPKSGGK